MLKQLYIINIIKTKQNRVQIYDQILKILPSQSKYNIFDKTDDNCEDIDFYNRAKDLIDKNTMNNDISGKLVKSLCYVYKKNENNELDRDDCNYLYFWLGDLLYKNSKNKESIYSDISILMFLLQSKGSMTICNNKNYYITEDNFDEMKILFDFSKDYDFLKSYIHKNSRSCDESFNIYFDERVKKYQSFKNMCYGRKTRDVACDIFNQFFKNMNIENSTNLRCTSVRVRIDSVEQQRESRRMTESYEKEEQQSIEAQLQENTTVHEVEGERVVQLGTLRITPYQQSDQIKRKTSIEGQSNMYTQAEMSSLTNRDLILSVTSGISSNPLAISSSQSIFIAPLFIGITVFSIIVYKFTPVGYWLKKALLSKSKRKSNIIMDRNKIEGYSILENLDSSRRLNVRYSNIY
ncbi:variable surface protein [Plasmodium gonderi]|uniref:Variable surface protein n=1 Tax=Plasmodium gonderi TaxID=77519 RepID=A0A1Y1JN08_PLAGO|nr:variable surface protein [Plasmodium gonderi]GAW83976.1 variable surface protein [Plasmodium gonderi]